MATLRKNIDPRIKALIENNVKTRMRSLFVVVGAKAKNQVAVLHELISTASDKAKLPVLWCYEKHLGMKKKSDSMQFSTEIQYCLYRKTHEITGNTYGMCVLQDFEALTPNVLAHTVETVEGGGAIVILVNELDSLRLLCDPKAQTTYMAQDNLDLGVVPRFTERLILSLTTCSNCLVTDHLLSILETTHVTATMDKPSKSLESPFSESELKLSDLRKSVEDTPPLSEIVGCCKTFDQAECVLRCINLISNKVLESPLTMVGARGRGKSATLGLAAASAVFFNLNNIFVTSPHPQNLKVFFQFVFRGFDALGYQEHTDYDIVQSTNEEFNKAIVRVNIYRDHRQTIQYIHPTDAHKLGQAELVVIDEAAAIPLPLVKSLMGPHLVFMASTVNGYEGAGWCHIAKLTKLIVNHQSAGDWKTANNPKIQMKEPIRYAEGDLVEAWLNRLLCLDTTEVEKISCGNPLPERCNLYYVNRDTLFSSNKTSEEFLLKIMNVYTSSDYKHSPDDMLLLSDSPSHHIFVLLPPNISGNIPPLEVLVVVQVCIEEGISQEIKKNKSENNDSISWTIAQKFQDDEFAERSEARIVRIATHPDYQRCGYGKQALQLLQLYHEGKILNLNEEEEQMPHSTQREAVNQMEQKYRSQGRTRLPPLLTKLSERRPASIDYFSISYDLTSELLKFWQSCGFLPVYLGQTQNALTGENSCIMLKILNEEEKRDDESSWLKAFHQDFQKGFITLLSSSFRSYPSSLVVHLLQRPQAILESQENNRDIDNTNKLTIEELNHFFTLHDMKRLKKYSSKLVDFSLIMDLIPDIAKLYFSGKMPDVLLSDVQQNLLVSVGLQRKPVGNLEAEVNKPSTQVMALLNKVAVKCYQSLTAVIEEAMREELSQQGKTTPNLKYQKLEQELSNAVAAHEKSQKAAKKQFKSQMLTEDILAQYKIKGREEDWNMALSATGRVPNIISVKRTEDNSKKRKITIPDTDPAAVSKKKKKKPKVPKN